MAYTAWSVVFGEQPTAAKWNQLGENDAGFKDGSNIDNNAIIARHIATGVVDNSKWRNAIAFSAYRSSSQNMTAGTFVKIVFDTEEYDLGANYNPANGRFTAPVNGIYAFCGSVRQTETARTILSIYKNGSEYKRLYDHPTTSAANEPYACHMPMNAGDTADMYLWVNSTSKQVISTPGNIPTSFSGALITRT